MRVPVCFDPHLLGSAHSGQGFRQSRFCDLTLQAFFTGQLDTPSPCCCLFFYAMQRKPPQLLFRIFSQASAWFRQGHAAFGGYTHGRGRGECFTQE